MAAKKFIVGLTGGIGSGKSTVASLFSRPGVTLIDTDAIAHALTTREGPATAEIRTRMGAQFIADDGSLDRDFMRNRIFTDKDLKLQLEKILHPLIHDQVNSALNAHPAQNAFYVMLVIPLLFETLAYRDRTQKTLLVDCPIETQIARVNRRSGLSAEETTRIVDAQLPRAVRLQLADDVICNATTADSLWSQVEPLHLYYQQNSKSFR